MHSTSSNQQYIKERLGKYAYAHLEELNILNDFSEFFVDALTAGRPYTLGICIVSKDNPNEEKTQIRIQYDRENPEKCAPHPWVYVRHKSKKIRELSTPWGDHAQPYYLGWNEQIPRQEFAEWMAAISQHFLPAGTSDFTLPLLDR